MKKLAMVDLLLVSSAVIAGLVGWLMKKRPRGTDARPANLYWE
jgi:hypothetical protein